MFVCQPEKAPILKVCFAAFKSSDIEGSFTAALSERCYYFDTVKQTQTHTLSLSVSIQHLCPHRCCPVFRSVSLQMGGQQSLYQLGFPGTDTMGQSALGGHPGEAGSAALSNHNRQCY